MSDLSPAAQRQLASAVRGLDLTLLKGAIALSGLSARSFAELIEVDERTVRRWIAGDREVPGPVRVIVRAIIRDPAIVAALTDPP